MRLRPINALRPAGFHEALHQSKLYLQPFDEPFQVRERAVIYGYRPEAPFGSRTSFISIRFPKELAEAIQKPKSGR